MEKKKKWKKYETPEIVQESSFLQVLPVLVFTVLVLFVIRAVVYTLPLEQYFWYAGNNYMIDGNAYARMVLIVAVGVLSLFSLLAGVLTGSTHIKKGTFYIPMGIYCAFVLLSYIFSDYKEFALLGFQERLEGTLTLLSYMVMLFYTYNFINSIKNVKWVIYSVAAACGLLGLVGVAQYFGFQILEVSWIKKLYVPSQFWDQLDKVSVQSASGIIQLFSNQNYVSFYTVMPLCLFGCIALGEQNKRKKIGWCLLTALFGFNLIAAASSSGIVGIAFSILVAVIVFRKRLFDWWKSIALLLVFVIPISAIALPRFFPGLKQASLFNQTVNETNTEVLPVQQPSEDNTKEPEPNVSVEGIPEASVVAPQEETPSAPPAPSAKEVSAKAEDTAKLKSYRTSYGGSDTRKKVDYIVTEEQNILFSIEGHELTIRSENQQFTGLFDKNGAVLPQENEYCTVKTDSLHDGTNLVIVTTDQKNWIFFLTEDGPRYVSPAWKLVKLDKVSSFGFQGNEKFATGRGYIWSRTLPLLKDTLFLGHGADTFCLYFPHQDYAGRYNVGFDSTWTDQVIDKPHNMYLDAAVGTGVLSLLALLVLYGLYLFQSFQIYWKRAFLEELDYIGVGIFLGVCGFLVAGLANDSTVTVMPLFYGLLGTGFAVNHLIARQSHLKKVK